MDVNGFIYLSGVIKKKGSSFLQVKENTITKSWIQPFIQLRSMVISPTGSYIGFTHDAAKMGSGNRSIEFGLLDINTNTWKNIAIPPLNTAELIPVTFK
jgi:hypothetical protein